MFNRKCETYSVNNKITAVDIGPPTDMKHHIHVTKNPETGNLDGLPVNWLKKLLTNKRDKNENPEVAQTTAKFYITEIKKLPDEPSSSSTITEMKKEVEEHMLNTQITPAEQTENPDAAIQTVKFHMYTIKKEKAPDEPFKPFLTDEAITEENKKIEVEEEEFIK